MTLHHGRGKASLFILVLVRLAFGLVVVANSVFVHPCFVHWVEPGGESGEGVGLREQLLNSGIFSAWTGGLPSLVEVNEKHHVVSEAGQPVGRGHGDDEGENVVDEGVKSLMATED